MAGLYSKLQPDQLVTDPYWPSVVLYMRGNTSDWLDETGINTSITVTGASNSSGLTNYPLLGTPNMYHPTGNGATLLSHVNLAAAGNTIFQMGTGDWTVEYWIYRISKASTANFAFLSFNQSTSAGTHEECLWQGTSPDTGWKLGWYNGTTFYQHPTVVPAATWTHCAICRRGTTMYLSVNGQVYQHGTANSKNMNNTSTGSRIGTDGNNQNQWTFYYDELRITKGFARYTQNFVVQNKQFPTPTKP